jgi:ABC-type phosphate transport system ATPase subunit
MPSKRARKKELQKKVLFNKTLSNMRKYVNNLEGQKEYYIKLAKEAHLNGSKEQYSLAINGLKMALAYQKKAKEMLLNFELTMQLRDLSSVTGEFLNGMVTLSKDMSKIINKQDYAKVQESFETAMGKVEEQNVQIENFLDNTEMSFSQISADPSNVSDKEISELIDFEAKEEVKEKDSEIDSKIEEIERLLNDM